MHSGRRNILIRWIGYGLVVIATAGWIYLDEPRMPRKSVNVMQRLAPKQVELPSEDVTKALRTAIDVATHKEATYGRVESVDPKLIVLDAAALEEERKAYRITTIFLGPPDKYAILGGVVYKEGDVLPDGRMVSGIDADGVDLSLGKVTDRLNWIRPYRVELQKVEPKPKASAEEETSEGIVAEEAAVAADQDTGGEQALPSELSPDQALQILQQIGSQQQQ